MTEEEIKLRKKNYCQWCCYARITTFGPNECLRAGGISQDKILDSHPEKCPFTEYPPDDSRARSLVYKMNESIRKKQNAWKMLE